NRQMSGLNPVGALSLPVDPAKAGAHASTHVSFEMDPGLRRGDRRGQGALDAGFALYVHWPFCRAKCPYCDFNSHVRDGIDQRRWREALLRELDHWAAAVPGRALASIFFGGGTPSLMEPATVAAVIEQAGRHWRPRADIEITLEANPTSVEAG